MTTSLPHWSLSTRELASLRRLLVFLPGPLGDAVMATPALRALRTALPMAHITWTGARAPLAALAGLALRDAVVPLDGRLARGTRSPWRAKKIFSPLNADVALLMPNSSRSALTARTAGIPIRLGTALRGRGALLTHRVEVPLNEHGKLAPRCMTQLYEDLVKPFGATVSGAPKLIAEAFDLERATLRLRHVASNETLIGINPGAAFGPSKVLAPQRIAMFLDALRAQVPFTPLILCGPGESSLAQAIVEAYGKPCVSTHASPPDVGELKALLTRCSLLATTDAGPRHIAEALGVPTLVWMGPTKPVWSAYSQAAIVRDESLACLGCHRDECPIVEPISHPCMSALSIDVLTAAAIAKMREASVSRGP